MHVIFVAGTCSRARRNSKIANKKNYGVLGAKRTPPFGWFHEPRSEAESALRKRNHAPAGCTHMLPHAHAHTCACRRACTHAHTNVRAGERAHKRAKRACRRVRTHACAHARCGECAAKSHARTHAPRPKRSEVTKNITARSHLRTHVIVSKSCERRVRHACAYTRAPSVHVLYAPFGCISAPSVRFTSRGAKRRVRHEKEKTNRAMRMHLRCIR